MHEKIDDRTIITRNNGVNIVAVFIRPVSRVSPLPEDVLQWNKDPDETEHLTLGEIREQVSGVIGWPIFVWVECPTGGEIYCTGNYLDETCWRRHGITGGYA